MIDLYSCIFMIQTFYTFIKIFCTALYFWIISCKAKRLRTPFLSLLFLSFFLTDKAIYSNGCRRAKISYGSATLLKTWRVAGSALLPFLCIWYKDTLSKFLCIFRIGFQTLTPPPPPPPPLIHCLKWNPLGGGGGGWAGVVLANILGSFADNLISLD